MHKMGRPPRFSRRRSAVIVSVSSFALWVLVLATIFRFV